MARSISLSLSLSRRRFVAAASVVPSCRFVSVRSQSSGHRTNQVGGDLQKLEDVIHRIIVRRSAPDWLPFVPGASYWVPPLGPESHGIAQLVEKLANPTTDEEHLSTTSAWGWPSSDYFIKGVHPHPLETEMTPNAASQSEDEEG